MKVLAVDLGDRRVGFAISDEEERFSVPSGFAAVRSLDEAFAAVMEKVGVEGAGLVVLGNPVNMDGRVGPRSREAVEFGERLREAGVEVAMWDERLTTSEATRLLKEAGHNRKRRKGLIDANSAQRFLESFLECRRRGRRDDV